mmetsp:Transcript_31390/g.35873  ORF Transcript_31390/g.35873 Transcript_31390/m.35873 type:complete len:119 (-) Transcript_31390:5802-6158(-)
MAEDIPTESSLSQRVQKALEKRITDVTDPKVELQVLYEYLQMGLDNPELRYPAESEEDKRERFDDKKVRAIANKICTATKILKDETLELAMDTLRLVVRYLKFELEDSNRMSEEIIEG